MYYQMRIIVKVKLITRYNCSNRCNGSELVSLQSFPNCCVDTVKNFVEYKSEDVVFSKGWK